MQIKGVRIDKLSLERSTEGLGFSFTVDYCLLSEKDIVIARQTCNGYNAALKLDVSAESAVAIRAVSDILKKEIEALLGF